MILDKIPTDLSPAEAEKVAAALDLILRNRQIRRRYKAKKDAGKGSVDAWCDLAEEFRLSESHIRRIVYEE